MNSQLPYPGLRAFTREESYLFFGRDSCVNSMIDRLASTRFMAVLGASGSGKSSLVHTGLIDALELGFFARAGTRWKVARCHPGGDPLCHLAEALVKLQTPVPDEVDVDILHASLACGPRSVVEWCEAGGLAPGENLLLLVDQFEELFRYVDYAAREEAEAFVALLLESARTLELPIYVVLTMRSEFLGSCALIPGLAEQINAGCYLTPRMTRDECRLAIEGPAGYFGFSAEPALVNQLLNDMASFAPWDGDHRIQRAELLSRRADQLPLMQHLLNRLWLLAKSRQTDGRLTLTLKDYDEVGGLRGALDSHGAAVMETLDAAAREDVETVFRALVSGTNPEDAVRRPCCFRDLALEAKGGAETARKIVNAFRGRDCNFLQPEAQVELEDETVVDISHESLIRQWSLLTRWMRDEAAAGQNWRRLTTEATRRAKGEGDLLTGRNLSTLAYWWDQERPTALWAARHGGEYELGSAFLAESRAAQDARRRSQKTTQRLVWSGIVLLVVLICTAIVWGWYQSKKEYYSSSLKDVNKQLTEAQSNLEYLKSNQVRLVAQGTKEVQENLAAAIEKRRELEEDIERDRKEKEALEGAKQDLLTANAKIVADNSQLTAANTQLKAGNTQLSAANAQLQAGNIQLASANDALSASVKALQDKLARAGKEAPAAAPQASASPLVVFSVYNGPDAKEKTIYEYPVEAYIDNQPYAFIVPKTSFSVRLPVGKHTICIADPIAPCNSMDVTLTGSGTTFVRIDFKLPTGKKRREYMPQPGSDSPARPTGTLTDGQVIAKGAVIR
jgi:hypothetical protein